LEQAHRSPRLMVLPWLPAFRSRSRRPSAD